MAPKELLQDMLDELVDGSRSGIHSLVLLLLGTPKILEWVGGLVDELPPLRSQRSWWMSEGRRF